MRSTLRLHLAPLLVAAVVSAGLGLLSGCGGDDATAYDDADVTFASEMAAHHQQALDMVDMVDGREVSPEFRDLADGIRAAQKPEIATMTGWLKAWDKPTPGASSDSDADGDPGSEDMDEMNMGGSMAGMMSADEMAALDAAPDSTFQDQWLRLMVEHHQGALTMAQSEIDDGRFPEAVELAQHIKDTQAAEITRMQAMLAQ